ncbi:MAG: phosphatase PAP2 family protein [Nitrospirae bacterium]|nr:phosphatase PAP2 family protein [Nitrospirota bacterium]
MILNTSIYRLSAIFWFIVFTLFPSDIFAESAFKTYGNIGQIALPAAALSLTAIKEDKDGAIQFTKAFSATTATTYALKYSINETRPNGGKHSFPSGHTAFAFVGAAFSQQRYGCSYGIPMYIAATLVGASRLTSKEHHFHDVAAGAVIGIGANIIFTKKFKENKLALIPMIADNGGGAMFLYSFK